MFGSFHFVTSFFLYFGHFSCVILFIFKFPICNELGIHHIFVAFSEYMNFQIEGSLKKFQLFIYPVKQIQMHTALHMNKHKSSKSEQVS